MTSRPRGRRPGNRSSRDDIVRAARREFAERGYERTTMRSIAAAAQVDPATIYHFFDDKRELLGAAVEFPVGDDVIRSLIPTDGDISVAAMLEGVLELWEQPEIAERLMALIRVAATHPDAGAEVSVVFQEAVLGPLTDLMIGDDAELRAGLVGVQLAGLALLRLVIPFAPIANASIEELVQAVSPTVDRYLTGELREHPPGRSPTQA